MPLKSLCFLVLAIALAVNASGSDMLVDAGTNNQGTDNNGAPKIMWWGQAFYFNDAGQIGIGVSMSGNLSLFNRYSDRLDNVPWSTLGGSWEGAYETSVNWADCYTTGLNAETFDQYRLKYGNSTCTGEPSPPPQTVPIDQPSNGDPCNREPICTPLVLNLHNGSYSFSSAADGVSFDLDGDGDRERVAWPLDGSSVAYLFVDRNGNGLPDDGRELFGNATRLVSGAPASDGFQALEEFDSSGDGAVTPADQRWSELRLWFDRNRDGQAADEEVVTLNDAEIISLALKRVWTGRRDRHGNLLRWKAMFVLQHDAAAAHRPYYDVYLTVMP